MAAEFKWKKHRMNVDEHFTHTSDTQIACEEQCGLFFSAPELFPAAQQAALFNKAGEVLLCREAHIAYLKAGLDFLPDYFTGLDARAWTFLMLCLRVLSRVSLVHSWLGAHVLLVSHKQHPWTDTLSRCQDKAGGFGGGPQQLAHTAPTYASVLSLLICGTEEAYKAIDRKALYRFFLSLKDPSGGFCVHKGGETDVRGTYTVLAIADLCNILTSELLEGAVEFVLRYAFCGFASLSLLSAVDRCNVHAFVEWITARQMKLEGGFQGRTNKLVDGCYSFWQGAAVALIPAVGEAPAAVDCAGAVAGEERKAADTATEGYDPQALLFDTTRLQRYILLCCQRPDGGLRDKPGKSRDFYHTCYCLSGLSIAQHKRDGTVGSVFGDKSNLLKATEPHFNIRHDRVAAARSYFMFQPCSHSELLGEGADPVPTAAEAAGAGSAAATGVGAGAGACASATGSGSGSGDAGATAAVVVDAAAETEAPSSDGRTSAEDVHVELAGAST